MMTVKLNDVDEFLQEMEKAPPNIEPVVRLTNLYTAIKVGPIRHVQVIATYWRKAGEDRMIVVRLERYVGDLWPDLDTRGKEVMARAEEAQKKIEERAQALGLEVRAGVYEGGEG